jgi:hypothetical protein
VYAWACASCSLAPNHFHVAPFPHAVERWNTVLSAVNTAEFRNQAEMQETARKLSGLLDTMLQHSKAIDELQRATMVDPITRVHSQVADLGTGMRKRVVVDLLLKHGGETISQLDEEERLDVMRDLMMGLSRTERVRLLCRLAGSGSLVGPLSNMLSEILSTQRNETATQMFQELATIHEARLGGPAERNAFRGLLRHLSASESPGAASEEPASSSSVEASGRDAMNGSVQRNLHEHADILAKCAVHTGPETTAGLPQALLMMNEVRQQHVDDVPASSNAMALLPLLHVMEKRCAIARKEEVELRMQVEELKARLADFEKP